MRPGIRFTPVDSIVSYSTYAQQLNLDASGRVFINWYPVVVSGNSHRFSGVQSVH
jgi:hypothetical protein